jgi:pimeloyl-ACP methyl ester carboxylesterase
LRPPHDSNRSRCAIKSGSFGKRFALVNGPRSPIQRYRSFAQATFRTQPELVRRYRDWIINFPDAENVFQCVRAVFERTDITEFLPRIVVPTLAIAGREDPAAPPAELQIIAERIPNARLLVIEQANHLLPAEKPREVAEAIRGFLRGLSLRAG